MHGQSQDRIPLTKRLVDSSFFSYHCLLLLIPYFITSKHYQTSTNSGNWFQFLVKPNWAKFSSKGTVFKAHTPIFTVVFGNRCNNPFGFSSMNCPSTCLTTSSESNVDLQPVGISFLIYLIPHHDGSIRFISGTTWTAGFWQAFLKPQPIYSLFQQLSKHFSEQAIILISPFLFKLARMDSLIFKSSGLKRRIMITLVSLIILGHILIA